MAEVLNTYTPAHFHEQEIESPEKPAVSKRWKWASVLGNAALSVAGLITGNGSTLSQTADAVHNGADAGAYWLQAKNLIETERSEQSRYRLRKLAFAAISLSSFVVGAKVGMDVATGAEHEQHPGAIYTASASVALNGLLLARMRKGIKAKKARGLTVDERAVYKHFWEADVPSAALAFGGTILQRYNLDIYEQAAALASSGWISWTFRPTKKNMEEGCSGHHHDDDHDHNHHEHEHHHESHPLDKAPFFQSFEKAPTIYPHAPKNDAIWMVHEAFSTAPASSIFKQSSVGSEVESPASPLLFAPSSLHAESLPLSKETAQSL